MDELTKLIDKLVQEKTFSLDAVGIIKDLRDKAEKLEKSLQFSDAQVKDKGIQIQRLESQLSARDRDIESWKKRETDLLGREAKANELEKKVAVEEARSGVWSGCFTTLFANRVVRESITTNVPTTVPSTYPGGAPMTTWNTETKNIAREEG